MKKTNSLVGRNKNNLEKRFFKNLWIINARRQNLSMYIFNRTKTRDRRF